MLLSKSNGRVGSTRTLIGVVGAFIFVAAATAACSGPHSPRHPSPAAVGSRPTTTVSRSSTSRTNVSTTTAPSRLLKAAIVGPSLPQPISRAVAVSRPSGGVLLLGGRTGAKISTDEIVSWTPAGSAGVGHLALAGHDSSGSWVGGRALIFGGGNGSSVADVQAVTAEGTGSLVGRLPQPRSDVSSVAIGSTAYVV